MKYTVRIQDRVYEVEIGNLYARPIIANVNGVPIEVWPESEIIASGAAPGSLPLSSITPQGSSTDQGAYRVQDIQSTVESKSNAVTAPIPGVIISIAVRPGDDVEIGQELCVLEAMKMKNTIRASRSGVVSDVLISVGLTVNHGDTLIKFAE